MAVIPKLWPSLREYPRAQQSYAKDAARAKSIHCLSVIFAGMWGHKSSSREIYWWIITYSNLLINHFTLSLHFYWKHRWIQALLPSKNSYKLCLSCCVQHLCLHSVLVHQIMETKASKTESRPSSMEEVQPPQVSSARDPAIHGGVNPTFLFLQLFHNQCFGMPEDSVLALPTNEV